MKVTVKPIKILQKEIESLEADEYLDLEKFNGSMEISILAWEINKLLLRINESEKSLVETDIVKKLLRERLEAENVSLRISNAFAEYSDFDAYISKIISIIKDYLSGVSKETEIKIGFINKGRIDFKYSSDSLTAADENILCKAICNAEFPNKISDEIISAVYCENTAKDPNYEFIAEAGIKSFLISPVYIDGKYKAVLCVEIFDEFANWHETERNIIMTVCSGIANAFIRKEAETEKNKALITAEINNKSKSEFLAAVSQEIRTPINAIVGLADIHLQQEMLPLHIAEDTEKIMKNAVSLLNIMNRIFEFSKLREHKMEITPRKYYLRQLLKEVCANNIKNIEIKNLDFICDIDENLPKEIFGDNERIKLILDNLLSNAVKFTPKGSVKITVKEKERANPFIYIYFSVKDTGIGIDTETQKNMLTEFYHLNASHSRRYGGIGIGFSIAREIVGLMGGEIEISSEIDKGSEFSFVIMQKTVDETAVGKFDIKDIFYENGFNDHITKPIDKIDLENLLIKNVDNKNKENPAKIKKDTSWQISENNFEIEILKTAKISGLDIITAMDNFNSNAEIYINALITFVNNIIPILHKIESVGEETLPEYAVLLHGIKGSCYGIGANECGDLARELEISAKKGDLESVLYKTKYFIQSINELISKIDKLLTEIKNTK